MKTNYVATPSYANRKNAKEDPKSPVITTLQLDDVSVICNDEAIHHISLCLKPGNVYGFSGNKEKRNALLSLLYGFTRPVKGSITVNDTPVNDVDNWTAYITLVKKEDELFSGSFSRKSGSKENIAANHITKTSLFDATAKALLKASPLLIFDETESSLSVEAEEQILRQISLHNKNSIIILNTNRPGALKYCDHIFLVKSNKIVEVSKYFYFREVSGMLNGFSENYYSEGIV